MDKNKKVDFLVLMLTALAYLLSAKAVAPLSLSHSDAVFAIWPPTGVALAAILFYGRATVAGVFLGAFLLNLSLSPVVPSLQIAITNTLGPWIAAALIWRYNGRTNLFLNIRSVMVFLGSVALASLFTALGGTFTLWIYGLINGVDLWHVGSSWLLGDLIGFVLVVPLVVALLEERPKSWNHWGMGLLVGLSFLGLGFLIFGPPLWFDNTQYPVVFLFVLPTLAATFWLGPLGASGSVFLLALVSTAGSVFHHGPFVRTEPDITLLLLQSFIAVFAVMVLVVAAVLRQKQQFHDNLQLAKESLYKAQEIAHLGSWDWNIQTGDLAWSDEVYRIFGVAPQEFGASYEAFLRYVHPDDRKLLEAAVGAAVSGERPYQIEHKVVQPNGNERIVQERGEVFRDGKGNPVRMLGTVFDITALKRVEQDLTLAKEKAEEASRIKSNFLATMSHELRTPMNGVLGMAQMLLESDLDQEQQRDVQVILQSGATLVNILSDILDLSKVEDGRMEPALKPFSVVEILEQNIRLFSGAALSKGLELKCSIDPAVEPYVTGDSQLLGQILSNLLANAVKFTPKGRVQADLKLLKKTSLGQHLRFSVTDTGIGIAPSQQERVFETFTQVEDSLTRTYGGTGLGLAIVKKLVELLDGKIGLTSQLGEGSCFSFDLFFPKSSSQEVEQTKSNPLLAFPTPQVSPTQSPATFLVVENDRINQLVLTRMLHRAGFEVELAENGAESLEKTQSKRYQLIFMDVLMPVLDGIEATLAIRAREAEQGYHTPIIGLTAKALLGDKKACLDAGMDDYLTKPILWEDLWQVIQKHLEGRSPEPVSFGGELSP